MLRAVPAGMARSLDGRIDKVPHGTITFDSLRAYVVGDELRRVHWRSSAKVGELMVREQLDTAEPTIVVLLDDRASAHPDVRAGVAESFESACEAAASIVAAAVREDLPVSLHLVTAVAARPYLDVLTAATRGAGDLDATLRRVRGRRRGGGYSRGSEARGLDGAAHPGARNPVGVGGRASLEGRTESRIQSSLGARAVGAHATSRGCFECASP